MCIIKQDGEITDQFNIVMLSATSTIFSSLSEDHMDLFIFLVLNRNELIIIIQKHKF